MSSSPARPSPAPAARKNLTVAEDGEEGLLLLRRKGRYQNAPQPDLILLDLNLPTIDGREVLAEIKSRPRPPPHTGHHTDELSGRERHPPNLRPSRQRIRRQATGPRQVHGGHEGRGGVLAWVRKAAFQRRGRRPRRVEVIGGYSMASLRSTPKPGRSEGVR